MIDFKNNRIEELVKKAGGLQNALIEAGFNVKPNTNKPHGYWRRKKNRVRAIRRLVKKLEKDVRDITQKDFFNNESSQLLYYYKYSPWRALRDAGYNINPWEMKHFPLTIWRTKRNRVNAVKWLQNKIKKKPENLAYSDFEKNRLTKLLLITKGVHNALAKAGYKFKRKAMPRDYWKKRKNRIKHIKKLVKRIGKPADEITYDDFAKHKLYQLLEYYDCSAIQALKDAGYDLDPEVIKQRMFINGKKIYVSNHGHKFRSIFERDLDNWFWNHGIRDHEHDVSYPISKMTCDFVIGDYWIEATGLLCRNWYKKRMERKKELAKKFKINLVCISYDDFYKPYILEQKLSEVLRKHGKCYNSDLRGYIKKHVTK